MASVNVSTTLQRLIALEGQIGRENLGASQSGGGGGTFDGMSERVGKLEIRADGVERRLDSIDSKLDRIDGSLRDVAVAVGRLPTREFLVGAVLAGLAVALAIAALTFNIADYASKAALQAEQARSPAPAQPQPIIITLPQAPASTAAGAPAPASGAPGAQPPRP